MSLNGKKLAKLKTIFKKLWKWPRVFFSPNRRKIGNSWPNGCFFVLPIKMNPAKISIPDCTLDTPVKKSSGKISFCLLPCLHNNERLQIKLATRFKIYSHPGQQDQQDSFSLGISLPEDSLKFFQGSGKASQCFGDEKAKRS